jgi:hypothetical protein
MDRDLKRAKMLISLVHDGELTDEERGFLERAVLRYPELKLEIYRHEHLHDLVGMVPGAAAPPGIEDRVLKAIRPQQPLDRPGRIIPFARWRFPAEVAGAMAAAVVIVFIVLISYPRLMGTNHKTAVLPHNASKTSTASAALGESSADETFGTRPSSEDVALVPKTVEDKSNDRLLFGELDDTVSPAPETDKNTFSSEISPSGVLTATGVTAEKVSKILVPPRDVPLSAAKKEVPMISTTFIASPSREALPPTILLIYHSDPAKAQKDIMDKAVSLGGTLTKTEMEGIKGKDEGKTCSDGEATEQQDQGEIISLPPEKIDELLDYLVSRYPEIGKEVSDIKADKTTPFIRIDVVPAIQ